MTFACIKKAKKKLKWTPKISFKEGLGFMMKELNNWKKAPLWTETKIKEATREWFKFIK
jgi:UDP-glucose 4-epimerase